MLTFMFLASGLQILQQRTKFSHRTATTLRSVIARSLLFESKSQFLHDISNKVLLYNIPDKLIINTDQTPSKYVATDNLTMAAKGEKQISRPGSNNKRFIKLALCESHNGTILPFQLFYKGKMARFIPNVDFSDGFSCCTMKNTGIIKCRPFASLMKFQFRI